MNGFFLIVPLLIIRYGVLYAVNRDALKRAAFFPPMVGGEKAAYWLYQLSTAAIFIYSFFVKVKLQSNLLISGMIVYCVGIVLCIVSTVNFGRPQRNGINTKGLYRFSRNPMYVAYFLYLLGCVLLWQSLVMLFLLIIFQLTAHWIILSEERWCAAAFGEDYRHYMKQTRRYI